MNNVNEVILDLHIYDNIKIHERDLIKENENLKNENKKLNEKLKLYENFVINYFLSQDYIENIDKVDLTNYEYRLIVDNFIDMGFTDLNYINEIMSFYLPYRKESESDDS